MTFLILGLLLIMFIAFCVMVWKAAENWRWFHMTGAIITMILATILLFPTAMSLKSRQAWHKIKEDLEKQLEEAEEEHRILMYGDPNDPASGEGLASLNIKLAKVGTEAGRRWRGLRSQNADPANVTLVKPVDPAQQDPNAPQNGANEPLIPQGLVVYGFAERPFPNVDKPIPQFYLGEFRVTQSGPTQVTLAPTGSLEPAQVQAISGGQATSWSLYEMLPLDGHDPFIVPESEPSNDNVLGRVDEQLVNAILRTASPETRADYLKDGQRDSPEEPAARWVKIEFTKKHSIDVDSPQQVGALEGSFFDLSGRSLDTRLQRDEGGNVSFAVGDTLVVKEEASKQLIDVDQVARLVDTYYLRPLNDYRFALRRIRLRINQLSSRQLELQFEQEQLQETISNTTEMLELVQAEKIKLEQDLAQTQIEVKAVREYHDQLVDDVRVARETLTRLYKSNHMREQELDRLVAPKQ